MAKTPELTDCVRGAECEAPGGYRQPATAFRGDRAVCRACRSADERERRAGKRIDPDRIRAVLPWATTLEREAAEAVIATGSVPAAAEKLGMSTRLLVGILAENERRAARQGYAPDQDMTETVPDGFRVKGVSTFYKARPDGTMEKRGQWVKSQADATAKLDALAAAVERISEPFRGAARPTRAPRSVEKDLLAVYPMGDPHLGMHAWAAETGANFNLQIAERNLVAAVDHLVDLAPPAETGLVISLGDFFHADNGRSTTTAGTYVDTDTRWTKVLSVGIRAMRRCVDQALEKHKRVRVICASGNHDELTSLALSLCLANFYERDPRVDVDTSPDKFRWHRHGACLLGVAHGDDVKPADLQAAMVVDRAKDWGETLYRYFYCGHVHHETVKELPGLTVETFRTLAPRDKWHSAKGYRSGQDMRLHVWHKDRGKILEHSVGIEVIA